MPDAPPTVLGIETSCDETAAAVVDAGGIRSNVVLSQIADHAPFGGVVPEIAARAHVEHLDAVVARAMQEAGLGFDALDLVAYTAGPGLAGGLAVGAVSAEALGLATGTATMAVNHLEGHALTARLTDGVAFPYLLLLVSGGHTQILAVEGVGRYRRIATTIDDAAGEAFDKSAKLLGLPYPGGPHVERAAIGGDPKAFAFPRPRVGDTLDMSFSGLKTAVRQAAERSGEADRADICASFQAAVGDVLADRCARALATTGFDTLVVAGGVAANKALRTRLEALSARLVAPPLALCTDNAAMIAWAGLERLRAGLASARPADTLVMPRWPLDGDAAARVGSGKRGARV